MVKNTKRKHTVKIIPITVILLSLAFTTALSAKEINISVAASMGDLFKELLVEFSAQHPDISIRPNFGPSGGLAKQIRQGAPADLYVSANQKWMAYLVKQDKIDISTQKIFAHNTLVFVGKKNITITSIGDVATLRLIGIGSPGSVPAGQYAKQALSKSGIYDQLEKDHKLIMAKDVRQALMYAERGETDGSFVYKTDAKLARRAVILFTVPTELHKNITYQLALTVQGKDNPDARIFYDYLLGEKASTLKTLFGFQNPN